jgi:hypothetical protein
MILIIPCKTLADVLRYDVAYRDKIEDSIVQSIEFCHVPNCLVTYLDLWFRHGYIKG